MERVKKLIETHQDEFPEFGYYLPIIQKAEKNVVDHPDICFETCKALLEGVSKTVIERTDNSVTRKSVDGLKFGKLLKRAARSLAEHENVIEDQFISVCASLADAMGNLRNARADISHGRAVPKHERSEERFAQLSFEMTAGLTFYLLDSLFARITETDEESPQEKFVKYDDNPAFNQFLDEETPLDERVLYSRALHEQYYEDYLIQLSDYEYEQEISEESELDNDADS